MEYLIKDFRLLTHCGADSDPQVDLMKNIQLWLMCCLSLSLGFDEIKLEKHIAEWNQVKGRLTHYFTCAELPLAGELIRNMDNKVANLIQSRAI